MRILFAPWLIIFAGAAFCGCGSGPNPATVSEVAGILVLPNDNGNGGGSNPNTSYIAAAAPSAAGFFTSIAQGCGGCQSGAQADYASMFAPPSLLAISLSQDLGSGGSSGSGIDLALSTDGTVYWAVPAEVTISSSGSSAGIALWMGSAAAVVQSAAASQSSVPGWANFPLVTPSTNPSASTPQYSSYEIVGMVAETDAVYVSVALLPTLTNETVPASPDSPEWVQGAANTGATPTAAHLPSQGLIFAVSCSTPPCLGEVAPAAVSTTFDPAVAIHTLVSFNGSLCWLDATSQVLCAPAGWAGTTPPTPTVLSAPSLPAGWSLVAVASAGSGNQSVLVWAAAPDIGPGVGGCLVWMSAAGAAPVQVYNGSQDSFFCRGLATDGQYAYFTMNEVAATNEGPSCTNCTNGTYVAGVVGIGIARVPLAGGAAQTLPLQSQSWYGPRRVFVDATYVYGVDPSYVLRMPLGTFAL